MTGIDRTFQLLSYLAVFFGFFALWISGTFGLLGSALFIAIMVFAWFLEGTRFQIGERIGTVLIFAAMPAFYILWKIRFFDFSSTETALPGVLARLILSLTLIKLFQRKSDRDWIFLYVMAFFEVLLAAGLSISALYLVAFIGYLFVMVCTIILFEMRKTDRATDKLVINRSNEDLGRTQFPLKRLPFAAVLLITAIIVFAVPMFFMLPRVGGAGIGLGQGGGSSSGFSDTVRLGGSGTISQNNEVVMRVRLDGNERPDAGIKWRGVAMDAFDNKVWRKTRAAFREVREKGNRDVIQVDELTDRENVLVQTIYLEPLDSPVLFVLPRAVGLQTSFPLIYKDAHDALSYQRTGERITYKVLSDISRPNADLLRADGSLYPVEVRNYLQLPRDLDPRVAEFAAQLISGTENRYDAAAVIEHHLQTQFGYTLEQKAGGDQPLSDFLFNVKEGHCEYFATAMAIMLRTQGIATRVVNGFQQGEYNETADAFVVRQREAHSWVEVYFPAEGKWVTFDPTPAISREIAAGNTAGFAATFNRYLEALEMFWIQYFVAFDDQEQRSLFTSIKQSVTDYNSKTSSTITDLQEFFTKWWSDVRGDSGNVTSIVAIGYGLAALAAAAVLIFLFVRLYRKIVKLKLWGRLRERFFGKGGGSVIEFYSRFLRVLSDKGIVRQPDQTPLEFAFALQMPEAVSITERYNSVRFGNKDLTNDESAEIENWLKELETTDLSEEIKN